jgi:iron transport multicopper oxidase
MDMTIANAMIAPDGFSRSAVLSGGAFPSPLMIMDPVRSHIQVNARTNSVQSADFQFDVFNQLTDTSMYAATSIHWHGLFHANATWADGVSFVSQCPIPPGTVV